MCSSDGSESPAQTRRLGSPLRSRSESQILERFLGGNPLFSRLRVQLPVPPSLPWRRPDLLGEKMDPVASPAHVLSFPSGLCWKTPSWALYKVGDCLSTVSCTLGTFTPVSIYPPALPLFLKASIPPCLDCRYLKTRLSLTHHLVLSP